VNILALVLEAFPSSLDRGVDRRRPASCVLRPSPRLQANSGDISLRPRLLPIHQSVALQLGAVSCRGR
jgi:hypothetical protein